MMSTVMRQHLLSMLWLFLLTLPCAGETRWCALKEAPQHQLSYPPIARAARLTGTVIERVTFSPQGKVLRVEALSGPPLIEKSIRSDIFAWKLDTDAVGEQPCQALIVADFAFGATPEPVTSRQITSVLHISVRAEILVLDSVMYEAADPRRTKNLLRAAKPASVRWLIRPLN